MKRRIPVGQLDTSYEPRDFTASPLSGSADNASGVVLGPMTTGRWLITAQQDAYWLRGTSTLAGTDVDVDEATPTLSNPIYGGQFIEIDVTGSSDNYVAFRTAAGTALVQAIKQY
ncbi:MAG: hypothetical protein DRI48_10360 [Chloroflexi bacterium]|nr:MAG: hypothetical protein DRI48_10360 [Chloroflexota bacterium]